MDICKYKAHLKEFNYPNINGLSDEQIVDIFTAENRFFLLTWITKNLNSQFSLPLEWSESTKIIFADLFYEGGFCTSSQKLAFVNGDSPNSKEQINIFDRIFNFLNNTFQKENVQPNQNVSSSEDLKLFLKGDINLFPSFGPAKLRSSKERQEKMKYCKEQIEKLRGDVENNISYNNDINFESSNEYDVEEIEKNIDQFKKQAIKLKEVSSVVRKVSKNEDAVEKIGFKPNFENKLMKCNSEVTAVFQYFRNMNLTESINSKELEEQKCLEQSAVASIIKNHAEGSSEIQNGMKNIDNRSKEH